MSVTIANNGQELRTAQRSDLARKLDAAGWGLFFIWVGIAFLTDTGWGIGLLGVGIITLGGQVVRKYYDLKLQCFWIAVGLLFLLCGAWDLLGLEFSPVPIVLIIAGLALLASVIRGRHEKG